MVGEKDVDTESIGSDSDDGSDSDSEDWDLSDNEAWPSKTSRYAPVGDAESQVSGKSSSRLTREFTMGTGFRHPDGGGNHVMSTSPANTTLPLPASTVGLTYYIQ
mmetsp:Transcript_645/g.1496  ORF Transcript_645/g.1496 Transcript_645/m.1496 type:complete len:105 (-) Transcript_645:1278-1592(-)